MTEARQIKVSVFMAASLDGYIARPDGDVAWLHDSVAPMPEGDDAGYAAFYATIDVLVLGRGSFEKVLTFEPFPYDKPVVVLSRSMTAVPERLRAQVTIESAAPRALVMKLAAQGYQHIYLDGGQVIQSFLREGLVDALTITRIPLLLGAGRPLFGHLTADVPLRHLRTQSWPNGFVQSTYAVVK